MSLYRLYVVRCNKCFRPAGGGYYTSGREARTKARSLGWKRVAGSASAGIDYCPPCAPVEAR